ncbi:FAD-dependent oxidoreductase [Tsuneonella mangrovi]|uniref:FAD-dependent oxidoreductase n=1 Tax=Tsuneonella mangrovi TaxID=1982042 RepID=UPI001F0A62F6|nr:FAD-dependent oxidoreductase [Tsuneonella mangrovi]
MSDAPIRVAVIGGGCAAMALAWELSKPQHNGRYEVTVYQEGWRLGGKGASGRGASGRIEEHGLHIWLGFYDNAFRMMRECHAELEAAGQGHVYGDWRDAWTPENDIALCSASENGGFQKWFVRMPARAGLPGDPRPPDEPFTMAFYMARAFELFRSLILDTQVDGHNPATWFDRPPDGDIVSRLAYLARLGTFASAAALAEGLGVLAALIRSVTPETADGLLRSADGLLGQLRQWIEDRWIADDPNRFMWEVADLTLATITGLMRYGIMSDPDGLDAIDDYECREWMKINGASDRALQSPFLRGLYDLSMGYVNGDPDRPSLSAGQGLRGTLRTFFGYRGAFMWRMRAGMGDVVFAPLYTAMKARGVKFEFFHRLTNMGLGRGKGHVATLTFDVQATVKGGGEYDPLVQVQGKPCWPSEPDLEQLREGDRIAKEGWNLESHWDRRRAGEKTLDVGEDFDFVALTVGVAAVPYVASEIVAHDPRWKAMCDNVTTVASQAFQVWLTEDLETLGWPGPTYITGAFAKPFDTWCDMAHVVPEEGWKDPPATSVYFCAALRDPPEPPADDDSGYPARRAAEVKASAEGFLQGPVRAIWPRAFDSSGEFRWEILKPAEKGRKSKGPARFASQYWRANVNPSDRYVIHTPGSWRYRISPLDITYDNLTLAGDWTDSGFHSGCVEGAVMSGLLAAHALSGLPRLEDITAYDHP